MQQAADGGIQVILQHGEVRHRIIVEIELPRFDQPAQRRCRQAVGVDRPEQFGGDRVAGLPAMGGAVEQIAPPLQPDVPDQWLAHQSWNPHDLDIERGQRQQRAARRGADEQGRGIAVEILVTDQGGAIARSILAWRGFAAHGTAINAAATRRPSPIMML